MTMRILLWSELFWPNIGGAELIATKLLLALRERGHEFAVLTRKDSPNLPSKDRYKGIPIYRFPFWAALMNRNLDRLMEVRRQVADLKRNFKPDVVHINGFGPTNLFFHSETKEVYPAPCLITLHSGIKHSSLALKSLGSADWVVGCSEATLDTARKLMPGISIRSSVIYNSLETTYSSSVSASSVSPRLLCIGRLSPEKGFDVAIAAFASLIKQFTHATLVIAGDGPSKRDLERQADTLNIGAVVEFVGWVAPNDIASLIKSSTLVLVPSRTEGLPLVSLEASFMARPVVATRVGGLPEVVVHGETGLLVEQEDSNALAKAVEYLLRHPKTAKRMGQAARRRAQRVFSWEQYVDAYDELYRRLIMDWRRRSFLFH